MAKRTSTVEQTKTRATKPAAKPRTQLPVSLPLVLSPKSAAVAQQVRAVLGQLVDDGMLQPLSFKKAHAFLAEAQDWAGPGYVVVMPEVTASPKRS